jgi:hypothetical protein
MINSNHMIVVLEINNIKTELNKTNIDFFYLLHSFDAHHLHLQGISFYTH